MQWMLAADGRATQGDKSGVKLNYRLRHIYGCLPITLKSCLLRRKTYLMFKNRHWNCMILTKQNVKSEPGSSKKIFLSICRNSSILSILILTKYRIRPCLLAIAFIVKLWIVDKKNAGHWRVSITVRHLRSNESASWAGFIVSRIQIRFLTQSIWGQNGLNPPQIATKIKLALCCKEFCENFRKQKFTKMEHFEIAQLLSNQYGLCLSLIY